MGEPIEQEETFIGRVRQLAPFNTRGDALHAIRAVLLALGERLRDEERKVLAGELPELTRHSFERCVYWGDFDRDGLFARVARHGGTERGLAIEQTEVVLRALGERLSGEARTRLARLVGPSIAALLEAPDRGDPIPRSRGTAGGTLASGREGSRHPLSEAGPASLAHSGSVAGSSNPHGAVKLSSAQGMTQEREGETLASGHPGASRTLAETKD